MPNHFLKVTHPLYDIRKDEWETTERRMRGGWHVLDELQRFEWETRRTDGAFVMPNPRPKDDPRLGSDPLRQVGAHYDQRKRRAVYLNFAEMFAGLLVGHVFRKAPLPDQGLNFGGLGTVARAAGITVPSRAEQVYYNTDGVGNDASQWNSYWTSITKLAMGTGHRWMLAEAPVTAPANRQDELNGQRPYLLSYSPLAVTNWYYEDGKLAFAILKFPYRKPTVDANGQMGGNNVMFGYRLLVRAGFTALGPAYSGGGWWEFGEDTEPTGRKGTWENTNGEIPMWPHFYERDQDYFSRSGVTELGNASIAWMNLESAASFDAWDAATSLLFLLGVDPKAFQVATDKIQEGSRYVPVPINPDIKVNPQVHDGSTGSVTSRVFDERMNQIRLSVREIAGLEASGRPESSGESKRLGFAESKSPRLTLLASEIETSQNTAIRFLEQRFGIRAPTGSTLWPRDYEIVPIMDRLERVFDLEKLSGYRSATVGTQGMMAAVLEAGLVADDAQAAKIKGEYEQAAKDQQERAVQEQALMDQARSAALSGPPRDTE